MDKFHEFLTLFMFYTIFKHLDGKFTAMLSEHGARSFGTEKLQEYDLVGKRGIKTRITSLQERNLSLELCSNMVIQRQPYVVSLNVTLKHWMTI